MFVATKKFASGQNRFAARQVDAALLAAHHVLLNLRGHSSLFILFQTTAILLQQSEDQPDTYCKQ